MRGIEGISGKIMVVDDDRTVVDGIKTFLENRGYEVIEAYSGKECLEKVREHQVEIVFLDIRMPESDGIETLRKIKKVAPDAYVVMITAFATVDTAVEAMKGGAADYLRKPFQIKDVQTSVLDALEELKMEREHEAFSSSSALGQEDAFETFKTTISQGFKGLCVSASPPEALEEEYELENTEYLQLGKDGEDSTSDPRDLGELSSSLDNFMSENENASILIPELDYLLEQNSLREVKELITELDEKVRSQGAFLILSADQGNMSEGNLEELGETISGLRVSLISDSIANPLRRKVLTLLDREGKVSFSRIGREIGVSDSPKLSFHLRKLKNNGIVEQDEEKMYFLTEAGEEATSLLDNLKKNTQVPRNVVWAPGAPE